MISEVLAVQKACLDFLICQSSDHQGPGLNLLGREICEAERVIGILSKHEIIHKTPQQSRRSHGGLRGSNVGFVHKDPR